MKQREYERERRRERGLIYRFTPWMPSVTGWVRSFGSIPHVLSEWQEANRLRLHPGIPVFVSLGSCTQKQNHAQSPGVQMWCIGVAASRLHMCFSQGCFEDLVQISMWMVTHILGSWCVDPAVIMVSACFLLDSEYTSSTAMEDEDKTDHGSRVASISCPYLQ